MVTFKDNGAPIGTIPLLSGSAIFTTWSLIPGTHTIVASYAGDANFAGVDSAPLSQYVKDPARTDISGDGKSDILWRNQSTGEIYRMFMNGFTIGSQGTPYTEPDTSWKVVGDGDFNHDRIVDMIWRNDGTGPDPTQDGKVSLTTFDNTGTIVSATPFYTEPDQSWKIVQTPDLDGDGRADVVWWNSATGVVYAMLMNGSTIVAQGTAYTATSTDWKIVAAGDFSGSGKSNQLVFENYVTGDVALVTITASGGTFTATSTTFYSEPDTAWKIVGTGDFDGDGKADLLWRNSSTGQVWMMLMNGTTIANQGPVYTEPNADWKIVAYGDYDGDGKSDILWWNSTTGQVYMQLMNGLTIANQAMIYQETNTSWHILGPWEYAQ